jgi:protoheme IX farnesyltransferase
MKLVEAEREGHRGSPNIYQPLHVHGSWISPKHHGLYGMGGNVWYWAEDDYPNQHCCSKNVESFYSCAVNRRVWKNKDAQPLFCSPQVGFLPTHRIEIWRQVLNFFDPVLPEAVMKDRYDFICTMKTKIHLYWPLIKSLQTGLLIATGLAGYMSARCPVFNLGTIAGLTASLFLSISGSTILNMWWDRDIDAKMNRTQKRPLASGKVTPSEALWFGLALSAFGVGIAVTMDILYGLIIFAGLFFDVVVYTIWLKRRTCWSIVWGGIAGGMPVLAGRTLGTGAIDWIGTALALGVLLWIPMHILTFSMRYDQDYRRAGVPTFPSTYGLQTTRLVIAISSGLAAVAMGVAAYGIGLSWGYLRLMAVLSLGLLGLALASLLRPSERTNYGLFKYASLYMLSAMLLMMI